MVIRLHVPYAITAAASMAATVSRRRRRRCWRRHSASKGTPSMAAARRVTSVRCSERLDDLKSQESGSASTSTSWVLPSSSVTVLGRLSSTSGMTS